MPRIDQLEKLLKAEPADVFLNFALAMEYFKAGQHDQALAQYAHVHTIDPNYVPAYFQKGNALANMGRTEDARAVLRQGIAIARQVGDTHAAGEMTDLLDSL